MYHTPGDDGYWAVRDEGAYLDDEPISVSSVEHLDRAVVALEYSPDELVSGHALDTIGALTAGARRTRHMGSSASELAMLARGVFDGLVGTRFQPWDVAAGHLPVAEAGGEVTHLGGADRSGRYVVSNGAIHDELRECLGESLEER